MSKSVSGTSEPVQFGELEHVRELNDERPTTCTIFPRDCSDEQLVTHWITAEEAAFVPLDRVQ